MTELNKAQNGDGGVTPPAGSPPATPNTEQPKSLEDQVKALSQQVQAAVQTAEEMKGALQEERTKRKEATQTIEELQAKIGEGIPPKPAVPSTEDLLKEFDEEEVANFKKVAAATGVVFKSDLEAQEALQQQKQQESGNLTQYNNFLTSNKALFGEEGKATPEQEQNWKVYSSYVKEVFDIDKETLLKTPNLSKKLEAALTNLKNASGAAEAREKGRTEGIVQANNAAMLSVGGGGGGSNAAGGDGEWKRSTPEDVVRANLARSGYTPAAIDEIINREKGIVPKT